MCAILWGVTEGEKEHARLYGDALAREIKAEMGRHDIDSVRELARRIGMNHATLNERLNKSSRSGLRTPLTNEELWRICRVLGVGPAEMVRRAAAATDEGGGASVDVG